MPPILTVEQRLRLTPITSALPARDLLVPYGDPAVSFPTPLPSLALALREGCRAQGAAGLTGSLLPVLHGRILRALCPLVQDENTSCLSSGVLSFSALKGGTRALAGDPLVTPLMSTGHY